MKSPYKIAREIGVSPQAVYQKLNKQLNKRLINHIKRDKDNKILIDEVGEKIIKDSFNQVEQAVDQSIEAVEQAVDQSIQEPLILDNLRHENEYLKDQIKILQSEKEKQFELIQNSLLIYQE